MHLRAISNRKPKLLFCIMVNTFKIIATFSTGHWGYCVVNQSIDHYDVYQTEVEIRLCTLTAINHLSIIGNIISLLVVCTNYSTTYLPRDSFYQSQ